MGIRRDGKWLVLNAQDGKFPAFSRKNSVPKKWDGECRPLTKGKHNKTKIVRLNHRLLFFFFFFFFLSLSLSLSLLISFYFHLSLSILHKNTHFNLSLFSFHSFSIKADTRQHALLISISQLPIYRQIDYAQLNRMKT